MKNYKFKKILLPVLLVIVIALLSYFSFHSKTQDQQVENIDNLNTAEQDIPQIESGKIINSSVEEERGGSQTSDFVTLKILDKNYQVSFENGDSVFDVMNKIKSDKNNNFDFKYKEYPSLGVFVEEINGLKNGQDKYWIYYVNGKEAEVGISKYILKRGDIISWNQE